MQKTRTSDIDLLSRITVSDQELAVMLGCGVSTARKIASDASAVVRAYGRRQNVVSKVQNYLEELAEA